MAHPCHSILVLALSLRIGLKPRTPLERLARLKELRAQFGVSGAESQVAAPHAAGDSGEASIARAAGDTGEVTAAEEVEKGEALDGDARGAASWQCQTLGGSTVSTVENREMVDDASVGEEILAAALKQAAREADRVLMRA